MLLLYLYLIFPSGSRVVPPQPAEQPNGPGSLCLSGPRWVAQVPRPLQQPDRQDRGSILPGRKSMWSMEIGSSHPLSSGFCCVIFQNLHLFAACSFVGRLLTLFLRQVKSDKNQINPSRSIISFHQGRLRLDTLLLRENEITVLTPGAFLNFEYINHTSLAGNPIRALQSGAFADTRIRVLDLSNCFISALSPEVK